MSRVAIQISSFLDPHNPGIVEAKLTDAEGFVHTFVDKMPIFTDQMLDANSKYPHNGYLQCRVLSLSQDTSGRPLMRIRTIESTEGKSEFVVLSSQLCE